MQLAVPAPVPERTSAPWGMLAAIDLHGCERGRVEDANAIRAFVARAIEAIGMRAHGPLHAAAVAMAHFGGRPTVRVLQR